MSLKDTTIDIQQELKGRGLYAGRIDGVYGPMTAAGIAAALEINKPVQTPEGFDSRTAKNLATLQPGARRVLEPFVRRAIAIAASMGVEAKVICGYRNKEDQEEARRRGASKAGWGQSWHNYGMAIDFGLFRGSDYLDSSEPGLAFRVYAAIGSVAPDYGVEWGGNWATFKDTPHFHVDTGFSSPPVSYRNKLFDGSWGYA